MSKIWITVNFWYVKIVIVVFLIILFLCYLWWNLDSDLYIWTIPFKISNYFCFDTYNWSFLLAFLQWTLKSFFMLSIRNHPGTLETNPRDLLSSSTLSDLRESTEGIGKGHWLPIIFFSRRKTMEKQISVNPQLGDGGVRDIVKSNLVLYFSPGSLFLRRFMGYLAGETRSPPKKM